MMTEQNIKVERTGGRWTKAEHQNFLLGLQLYGKNWKQIQQLVVTRTGSQIRSHAQKFFHKFNKDEKNEEMSNAEKEVSEKSEPLAVIFREGISDQNQILDSSFFMHIITKMSCETGQLNFWDEFIDCAPLKAEVQNTQTPLRKNSFMTIEGCYETKQESPLLLFTPYQQ